MADQSAQELDPGERDAVRALAAKVHALLSRSVPYSSALEVPFADGERLYDELLAQLQQLPVWATEGLDLSDEGLDPYDNRNRG